MNSVLMQAGLCYSYAEPYPTNSLTTFGEYSIYVWTLTLVKPLMKWVADRYRQVYQKLVCIEYVMEEFQQWWVGLIQSFPASGELSMNTSLREDQVRCHVASHWDVISSTPLVSIQSRSHSATVINSLGIGADSGHLHALVSMGLDLAVRLQSATLAALWLQFEDLELGF